MKIKQVIVIRKDLKMRRGKEIAQGSHASMKFLSLKLRTALAGPKTLELALTDVERDWIKGKFAKICVRVDSEEELLDIHQKALDAGLTSCIVKDAGLTEFNGVPTITCIGIGPDDENKIDPITRHLKLY